MAKMSINVAYAINEEANDQCGNMAYGVMANQPSSNQSMISQHLQPWHLLMSIPKRNGREISMT